MKPGDGGVLIITKIHTDWEKGIEILGVFLKIFYKKQSFRQILKVHIKVLNQEPFAKYYFLTTWKIYYTYKIY